jgi:hypothetical protein
MRVPDHLAIPGLRLPVPSHCKRIFQKLHYFRRGDPMSSQLVDVVIIEF